MKIIVIASLLAIIPVLVLGSISYFITDNSFREEIGKTNKETVTQVQARIEQMLQMVDRLSIQLAFNPSIYNILYTNDPEIEFNLQKDVEDTFRSNMFLSDEIMSIYLYMPKKDFVVLSEKTPNYSHSAVKEDSSRIDPVILNSFGKKKSPFYWMEIKNNNSTENKYDIVLIRQIPVTSDNPLGYLIIYISDKSFFDVTSKVNLGESGKMFILTPEGNVFSNSKNRLLPGSTLNYSFVKELQKENEKEMTFTKKINGERIIVNYLQSKLNGWKYITLIPVKELTSKFKLIEIITIVICLLLIALSLLFAILLSKKLFKNIQNVIDIIKGRKQEVLQVEKKANEFELISNYLLYVNNKNDSLEKEIKDSKPLLLENFLHRILTEELNANEIDETLKYFGITFISRSFTVICIEIDNLSGQTEEDINLFLFATTNIVEEIMSNYCEGITAKINSMKIAIIMNHKQGSETALVNTFQMVNEIKFNIEKHLKITATIGIGHCYEGIDKVCKSYDEAIISLQYQLVYGSGTIIYFDKIKREKSSYIYPVKIEQNIIINTKIGNLHQVCVHIDDFAKFLKNDANISYEYVLQSFTQLITSTVRVLYEKDSNEGHTMFDYNLYQKLNEFHTTEKIIEWLKQSFYPSLINYISGGRNKKSSEDIEKILDYIHQHYNEDLSQYVLAELVSMSPSQFSILFKEEVGINFSDYIINYRIKKAKELLISTDMKVSDIAELLRYNNSQNFIRIFKQLTGITPGEYRANGVNVTAIYES